MAAGTDVNVSFEHLTQPLASQGDVPAGGACFFSSLDGADDIVIGTVSRESRVDLRAHHCASTTMSETRPSYH